MFDARLGLALGKTQVELRKMPAPDYRDFELLYLLEPWGWQNQEYLIGKIVATLKTIAAKGKKSYAPKEFMRDDIAGIKGELDVDAMLAGKTPEEIKQIKIARAKMVFGISD